MTGPGTNTYLVGIDEVAVIEENEALNAGESRIRVKEAVNRVYTRAI